MKSLKILKTTIIATVATWLSGCVNPGGELVPTAANIFLGLMVIGLVAYASLKRREVNQTEV